MPPKTSHGQPETADYFMAWKHHPCPQSIACWYLDVPFPFPFLSLPAQFPSPIKLTGTAAHCLMIGLPRLTKYHPSVNSTTSRSTSSSSQVLTTSPTSINFPFNVALVASTRRPWLVLHVKCVSCLSCSLPGDEARVLQRCTASPEEESFCSWME
jgi:hypothetical protein